MITITSHTSRSEFLAHLSEESLQEGTLEIQVEKLPSFLNTPVAFTIFLYQLSNYPRHIVWSSHEDGLITFLRHCGLNVKQVKFQNLNDTPTITFETPKEGVNLEQIQKMQDQEEEAKQAELEELIEEIPSVPALEAQTMSEIAPSQGLSEATTAAGSAYGVANYNSTTLPEATALVEQTPVERPTVRPAFTQPVFPLRSQPSAPVVSKLGPVAPVNLLTLKPNQPVAKAEPRQNDAQVATTQAHQHFRTATEQPLTQQPSTQRSLTPQTLLDERFYQRSSLLDGTGEDMSGEDTELTRVSQDLDAWLDKINSTKEALEDMKERGNKRQTSWTKPAKKPKFHPAAYGATKYGVTRKSPTLFYLMVSSLCLSVLVVAMLFLGPVTVYNVEVSGQSVEASGQIQLKTEEFSKQTVTLKQTATTDATGINEIQTSAATGKVNLVNPAGSPVNLSNGQFYLVIGDKKYIHEETPSLGKVVTIPAGNNRNGPVVEVNIRAVQSGSQFNLPADTKLDIYNLLNKHVCSSCFAVTVTEIRNTASDGKKKVQESDQALLRTTNEGALAQDRLKNIEGVQSEKVFTNVSWYKNTASTLKYTKNVGEITEKVSLTTEVTTDIYYLPQSVIENKLKEQNQDINKFRDIVLKTYDGTFEKPENIIKLSFFYTYTKKADIDKNDLSQTLTTKEFTQAQDDIKKQYPSISNIEKKQTGIQVPLLPSRVDVKVMEEQE